jgi:hypothetical protein
MQFACLSSEKTSQVIDQLGEQLDRPRRVLVGEVISNFNRAVLVVLAREDQRLVWSYQAPDEKVAVQPRDDDMAAQGADGLLGPDVHQLPERDAGESIEMSVDRKATSAPSSRPAER